MNNFICVHTEEAKTIKDPQYTLWIQWEPNSVYGSIEFETPEETKRFVEQVVNRINNGDMWAWARIQVLAKRGLHKGKIILGGNTYENKNDFFQSGACEEMKGFALIHLENQEKFCIDTLRKIGLI